jgi:hypothetical protein
MTTQCKRSAIFVPCWRFPNAVFFLADTCFFFSNVGKNVTYINAVSEGDGLSQIYATPGRRRFNGYSHLVKKVAIWDKETWIIRSSFPLLECTSDGLWQQVTQHCS